MNLCYIKYDIIFCFMPDCFIPSFDLLHLTKFLTFKSKDTNEFQVGAGVCQKSLGPFTSFSSPDRKSERKTKL